MKKANVNLFDKNEVQVKLLKNKNLRISDGRKHPTKIINLQKTGVTIWTDGKHLKVFRGNLLTEIVGRSVYRANKLETVEFIGVQNIMEGRSIDGDGSQSIIGVQNIMEGRSIDGDGSQSIIGVQNIMEGRSINSNGSQNIIGVQNIMEGRSAGNKAILVIGSKTNSEARILEGDYLVHMISNGKSITVRHGKR